MVAAGQDLGQINAIRQSTMASSGGTPWAKARSRMEGLGFRLGGDALPSRKHPCSMQRIRFIVPTHQDIVLYFYLDKACLP